MADAATLIGAKRRSVSRWVNGYSWKRGDTVRRSEPLWTSDFRFGDDEPPELSFRDLIELRFVTAFVSLGLNLRVIRTCLDHARECVASDRPFSTRRFRTDGKTIFLQGLESIDDGRMLDLKNRQHVIPSVIERTFKDLDLDDEVVVRWRPYKGRESIVIDPQIAFGQPVLAGTATPSATISDAVEAEGSIARVAALFDVDAKLVRDAVGFEAQLLTA